MKKKYLVFEMGEVRKYDKNENSEALCRIHEKNTFF
jgi:hypothetical protein